MKDWEASMYIRNLKLNKKRTIVTITGTDIGTKILNNIWNLILLFYKNML